VLVIGRRLPGVVLALGVGFVEIVGTHFASHHQPGRRPEDALGIALLVAGAMALAFRQRFPVAVLAVAFGTTLAYSVIGYAGGPIFVSLIVAFFTAVLAGRRKEAIASLVAGYLGFLWLGALLHRGHAAGLAPALGLAAWLLVMLAAAEALRVRRTRQEEAAHIAAEEARRRVSEERLRIAHEVHDVVAHNISLINVQAATTLHLMHDEDGRAAEALSTIKRVSQETLAELRSVLGVLRQVDEDAPLAPVPTLARLDELITRTSATGVDAHVEVEGTPRQLPASVDLAAYRIVQEALTNVVRHAGTPDAAVRIVYSDDALVVQVDDNGATSTKAEPGNGIVGMTERAAALGGNLQAGPRPGGGFRVRAWLPVDSGR
jgi:signal transduction histidine kinase